MQGDFYREVEATHGPRLACDDLFMLTIFAGYAHTDCLRKCNLFCELKANMSSHLL